MSIKISELKKILASTEIVSSNRLNSLLEEIPDKKDRPSDSESLVNLLVEKEIITAYQGQVLLRGKGKSLRLGNYLIRNKLGQGGMGMVFHARHVTMKREVALKVVSGKVAKNSEMMQRFQREVQATGKLHHPNIVVAHDSSEDSGTAYLVMEYIQGKDLSAIVKKKGPLSVAHTINLIRQAAEGLEYAHSQGVIHRDIKPSNLLLDQEGTLKILDMGLARFEEDEGAAELTATGAVMGTIDYMAPEQAVNTKHADAQSDVYSLGCTLWYLLLAKPIFTGESMIAKILAHRSQPTPSLREEREDIPEELMAIFEKMVAKKPENRYASMTELIEDLDKFKSGDSELTAMRTSFSAADDQLQEFLGDSGTLATPGSSTRLRASSVDSDTDQEFFTNMIPPVKHGQSRVERKQRPPWWKDWRMSALLGAAVSIIFMVVMLGGGDSDDENSGNSSASQSLVPEAVTTPEPLVKPESKPETEVATTTPQTEASENNTSSPENLNDPKEIELQAFNFLRNLPELTDWQPLTTVSASGQEGTVLNEQPDGSILASGERVYGEEYEVVVTSDLPAIHALKLEVFPHESLPDNGPGRGSKGVFHVDKFEPFRIGPNEAEPTEQFFFSQAFSNSRTRSVYSNEASLFDPETRGYWMATSSSKGQRFIIFVPQEPIVLKPGEALSLRMGHLNYGMGCFRFQAAPSHLDINREKLVMMLREGELDDERLKSAAAFMVLGYHEQARKDLDQLMSLSLTDSRRVQQLILLILNSQELGDTQETEEFYQQLKSSLSERSIESSVLRSLTIDYLTKYDGMNRLQAYDFVMQNIHRDIAIRSRELLKTDIQAFENKDDPSVTDFYNTPRRYASYHRWQQGADLFLKGTQAHPKSDVLWMGAASYLLMAGNDKEYRKVCRDFVREFDGTTSVGTAERLIKTCLLQPDTMALSKLPIKTLENAVQNESGYLEWYRASFALLHYREKKYTECIKYTELASQSRNAYIVSLALMVQSMAEFQLEQAEDAIATYRKGVQLVPIHLRRPLWHKYGSKVMSSTYASHDWLISEILRHEAQSLIFPESRPADLPPMKTIKLHSGKAYSVVFSPDGHLLAATGGQGKVRIYEAATGTYQYALKLEDEYDYHAIAFSPDS